MHRPNFLPVWLLAVVLWALWPPAANAHGGTRVLRTESGPYQIEATISRAGGMIDETVSVRPRGGGDADATTVAITLEDGDGQRLGPFIARKTDGGHEARYPTVEGAAWTVLLDIRGPAGDVSVSHPYRLPGGDGWTGRPGLLLNVMLAALLVAAIFLVPRLGRRKPTPTAADPAAARRD